MILVLLILITSIFGIAVFFWFRMARYPFPVWLFFCSLLAGATSFFLALLLQEIVPADGGWGLFALAFTEELSRIPFLIILLLLFRRFSSVSKNDADPEKPAPELNYFTTGAAAGLVAGLGFAILEGAVYSAANPELTLLRACTSVPLHAACGSRIGSAVVLFKERPIRSITLFLFAVAIHGVYNTMLNIGLIITFIAAILIAISALASTVITIRSGMKTNTGKI